MHTTLELETRASRLQADLSWIPGYTGVINQPPTPPAPGQYVTVITSPGAAITLDGVLLTTFEPAGSYVVATVEVASGAHALDGTSPFAGFTYGLTEHNAYTVNLGYDCLGCAGVLGESGAAARSPR